MRSEKILITGGAGFIGSHLADVLSKKGYSIVLLDNLSKPTHPKPVWPDYLRGKKYQLIKGDITRKKDWQKSLAGVSYVFHLAAYQDQRPDYHKFFSVNTVGTALLYEVAAQKKQALKKIILASTQFVYGDGLYRTPTGKYFYARSRNKNQLDKGNWEIKLSDKKSAKFIPFKESQIPNPINAYGLSKLSAENLAFCFGKNHSLPTTILRYSIVQGARQSPYNFYSGALRIFVQQALKNQPLTVFEDGQQLRDFINIKDAVSASIKALESKKTDFQILNVGGGKAYKVLWLAELVKRLTKTSSEIKIGGYRETDTRHAVSDITKIKKMLSWQPKFTPGDSVREYLNWYKKL